MRPGETQILQVISNAGAIFLDHQTKMRGEMTTVFLQLFQMCQHTTGQTPYLHVLIIARDLIFYSKSLNRKFLSEVPMHDDSQIKKEKRNSVGGVLDAHSPCKSTLLCYFSVWYLLVRTPWKEGKEKRLFFMSLPHHRGIFWCCITLLKAKAIAIHVVHRLQTSR